MLAAMLLLGILPLAALPFIGASKESGKPVDTGSYRLGAEPRLVKCDGFMPGINTVQIDLTTVTGDIIFTSHTDPTGFSLSHSEGTVITVRFRGLRTIPSSDVSLILTDPFNQEPTTFSLKAILADAPDTKGGMVIAPFVATDEIIAPTAYLNDKPQPIAVAAPAVPKTLALSAPKTASNDIEGQTPNALPDFLGDRASAFMPRDASAPSTALEIDDFFAGEDVLRLAVPNPDTASVVVGPSPDRADGWVKIDGRLVAVLKGAPDASEWDVYLEAMESEAAA